MVGETTRRSLRRLCIEGPRHHKAMEHHFEVKNAFNCGWAFILDFALEAITFMAAGLL